MNGDERVCRYEHRPRRADCEICELLAEIHDRAQETADLRAQVAQARTTSDYVWGFKHGQLAGEKAVARIQADIADLRAQVEDLGEDLALAEIEIADYLNDCDSLRARAEAAEAKIAAAWSAIVHMPGGLSDSEVRSRIVVALEPDWSAARAELVAAAQVGEESAS